MPDSALPDPSQPNESVPASRVEAQASRIARAIQDIGKIGPDPGGGWTRLAFSHEERAAHDVVVSWLEEIGVKSEQDAVGNTWLRREGTRPDRPPIFLGSHLDTVPQGGLFDGVAGVVAMVETMRLLDEHSVETSHPVFGVVFSAEEGARFGEPCIGSKSVAGLIDEAQLNRLKDAAGVSVADAMRSVGLDPERVASARWNHADAAAFLELHIEQGRLLEENNATVGLVDVVSGSTRIHVSVTGEARHSGATPMRLRADALAAAAQMILAVESLAADPFHRGLRATVGWVHVEPNSATTIPGRVSMMIDLRDTDADRQHQSTEAILGKLREISDLRGVGLAADVVASTSPVVLSMWLRELLKEECMDKGTDFRVFSSGAGHDAQIMARLFPSALLFVPSAGGISHHPEEWTSPEAIARGVEVLAGALVRLDAMLISTEAG